MPRVVITSFISATVLSFVVACGGADEAPEESSGEDSAEAAEQTDADTGELTATLVDPEGAEVGTVTFEEADEGTEVPLRSPASRRGFHGFHVHAIGVCEPDSANPSDPSMTGDFLSAGGHVGVGESDHGEHPGDLPSLYVGGRARGS